MTDAPAVIVAKPRVRWPLSLIVGATLTAVVLATALLALAWTPYDVEAVNIAAKLTAPNAAHPFGTAREIEIGMGLARAHRVTYVGELGWELYVSADQAAHVFEALVEAVKTHSLGQISHALYDVGGEYRRNM